MSDPNNPETLFLEPFPLEAAALQLQELEQQSFAASTQQVIDAALAPDPPLRRASSPDHQPAGAANNPLETLAAASPDPAAAQKKKRARRQQTKLTPQEENELLKRQLAEREQEIALLKQQLGKTTATSNHAAPQGYVNPATANLVGDAVLAFAATRHDLPADPNDIKNLQERWKARFQQLVRFKLQYGHCNVSKTDDTQLHSWVRKQRTNKKVRDRTNGAKGLTREQVDSLESIGFQWVVGIGKRPLVKNDQWQTNYEKLVQYRNLNGHVPVSIPLDKPLTKWMQNQRARKKLLQEYGPTKSKGMTWDRVQRLDAIGFKWGSKDNSL